MNNCIIIPIYYKIPTVLDKLSINSLSNLEDIKDYDIIFVCPQSLTSDNWSSLLKESIDAECKFLTFDDKYFVSTKTYSEMLKSYNFWKQFKSYEYGLIFQTDGYCISGKLSDYIDMDYDYIGGVIISENANWWNVPCIGNGGVSLRKISKFLELTDPDGECLKTIGDDIKHLNDISSGLFDPYEDLYFIQCVGRYWDINIPSVEIGYNFCFDMNPEVCYQLNGQKLPLFMHSFDKNIRYWQHILEPFSDIDIISESEWKNKDGLLNDKYIYHNDMKYTEPIYVGACIIAKNGNYCIEDCISSLKENGVKQIVILDNNELSGERVCLQNMSNITLINDFVGCTYENTSDLISKMYKTGYDTLISQGMTHVLFVDCDEVYNGNINLTHLAYNLRQTNYSIMHIPSVIYDKDGNVSEYQNHHVNSLAKAGLNLKVFTRQTPLSNYKTCDTNLEECEPINCKWSSYTDIHFKNYAGCKSWDEYKENKLHRGYAEYNPKIGMKMTSKDIYEKINGKVINNSTVDIS